MGLIIPEDFDLSTLPHSESRVIRSLETRLSDSWLILPRYDFTGERRPYEIDVLLLNPDYGILAMEVKGGRGFSIRDGEWFRDNSHVSPSPLRQSHDSAHQLRKILRKKSKNLKKVHVESAVVLPDVVEKLGNLPAGTSENKVFLNPDLHEPRVKTNALMCENTQNDPLSKDQMDSLIDLLRPDADFKWNEELNAKIAEWVVKKVSEQQIKSIATLDQNRRIFVTGAAGTGKTYLACRWAERAVARGERTLLTCYNEPIADWIKESVISHDLLTVGSLQKTLFDLAGLDTPVPPDNADSHWWENTLFEILHKESTSIQQKFDTIIIDEGQDFSQKWTDMLESMLNPNGPEKFFLIADPDQMIYDRGFSSPSPGPDIVKIELALNCRNTHRIADLIIPYGGKPAVSVAASGEKVGFYVIETEDEVLTKIAERLEELVIEKSLEPRNILVLTAHTKLRDLIRDQYPGGYACQAWESRDEGEIVCETISRSKGLERHAVILATTDSSIDQKLLYVGISRAISSLTVIAPKELISQFPQ